jgi:hypothetical protein
MNSDPQMAQYREKGLAAHQAHLVATMLSASIPVRHLLVASPGTGKSHAAMFLAREVAAANPKHRILVIGPRVLASMYEYELKKTLRPECFIDGRRRNLRELEASTKEGESIWPAPAVVVMGMDTARQEDVLRELCSTTWDLVVVEEVHLYGRARWTLLKTVLREPSFQRVLMVTPVKELKGLSSLLKGVTQTEWRAPALRDWDGKPIFPSQQTKVSTIAYRRSEAEVALLKDLLQLVEGLAPNPVGSFVGSTLLKRAASSPLALEQILRRLRNSLAHGAADFLSAVELEGFDERLEIDGSAGELRTVWKDKSSALDSLSRLIAQTESLTTDHKREALQDLVKRLQREVHPVVSHTCIFCIARATANYLTTTFTKRGVSTWLFTSGQKSDDFQAALSGFTNEGGILVCTAIALQGIDLRNAQAFVHYDPPSGEREMLIRISRGPSASHYLLKDESGILDERWPMPNLSATPPDQGSE